MESFQIGFYIDLRQKNCLSLYEKLRLGFKNNQQILQNDLKHFLLLKFSKNVFFEPTTAKTFFLLIQSENYFKIF
jgi:hypothetical protein